MFILLLESKNSRVVQKYSSAQYITNFISSFYYTVGSMLVFN